MDSTANRCEDEQTFFNDPALDRLMGSFMALAIEHFVTRDRLQALETQLLEKGLVDQDALSAEPTAEEKKRHASELKEMVRHLFEPLLGTGASVSAGNSVSARTSGRAAAG